MEGRILSSSKSRERAQQQLDIQNERRRLPKLLQLVKRPLKILHCGEEIDILTERDKLSKNDGRTDVGYDI